MAITELNPPIVYSQMGTVAKNVESVASTIEQKCRSPPQRRFLEIMLVPLLINWNEWKSLTCLSGFDVTSDFGRDAEKVSHVLRDQDILRDPPQDWSDDAVCSVEAHFSTQQAVLWQHWTQDQHQGSKDLVLCSRLLLFPFAKNSTPNPQCPIC